jgi:MoaA/NifB/PqqE/SkfB family radical SAM enzyme
MIARRKVMDQVEIEKLHAQFDKLATSDIRRRFMFFKMNVNRVIQSAKIVLSKPNIWKYVLLGFLNSLRGKRSLLRSLELAVTYKCNASCEQCSCRLEMSLEKERNEKLSIEEFKDAVDQAVNLGAFQFCINGGEPMLEPQIVYELVKHIKGNHKRYVHLCSNGFLLNRDRLIKLKNLGLDSLEMGFDSAEAARHDLNRINGSYGRVMKNIEICKELRIPVVLNTVLTNDKVKSADMIETVLLAKSLGVTLQITPCCLTGSFKNRIDLMLTEEAKLYFYWLLSLTPTCRSDLYSSLTKIKCPAAIEKIGLQPYGDLVSCPLIQIKYGNIRNASLAEIQQEMLKNPVYGSNKADCCMPAMSSEFIKDYLNCKL